MNSSPPSPRETSSRQSSPAEVVDVHHPASEPQNAERIAQLEQIADWMDRRFLDPVLGFLFPGAGDTLGTAVGIYGVLVALQMKVHPVVITRMLVNLAIDSIIGSIPILGDLFDVFYRAHVRNLELVKTRAPGGRPHTSDWFVAGAAALLLLCTLLLPLIVLGTLIALVNKML